ncbi:MAG: hypothetical protein RMM17_13780 [Acidobacteriota bacterium]|nr:hypothetical protein [Blastocatellia bacterium]MDW8413738.1 hypothetical protein [Acidobacteriota bacterium]
MKKQMRTTEDILREMTEISKGIGEADSNKLAEGKKQEERYAREGGALKSLLNFFVKVHDAEDSPPKQAPLPTAGTKQLKGAAGHPDKATSQATAGRLDSGTIAQSQSLYPNPKMVNPQLAADLSKLMAAESVPQAVEKETGVNPAEKPLEEIYKQAGITGKRIEQLVELMNSPTVQNQPTAVKVVAVKLALSAKGEKIEDYIADAISRDSALDAYQVLLSQRAKEAEEQTKERIENIQKEVEEFLKKKQVEIEKLRAYAAECNKQSIDFAIRRLAEEQRLADIIAPFLEGAPNPVSVGNEPDKG